MPTVKTREFKHTSKSGETYQFKAPITVDAHGEFTVNLPEELVPSANELLKQTSWAHHVKIDQGRVHWRVQGSVLAEVERFIEVVLAEHTTVEETRELVIRYRYENNTAGARAEDGTLHPNGHWAAKPGESSSASERSWTWAGNPNAHAANRPGLFGVGVVAKVYMKVTYTRPNSTRSVYTDELPGSHFDQNPMRRLNGFIVDAPERRAGAFNSGILSGGKSPSDHIHEIPYTDQAALFFADLMVAMMRLGEQLDTFVGNKDNLQRAIEGGGLGLLPYTTASQA